ncbi:MAG: ABC transporter permease [Phycisphaerales bacterium]|nr:ABC transporter permease [Phycisphaerales bacterium]
MMAPRKRSLVQEGVLGILLIATLAIAAWLDGPDGAFISPATQLELSTHIFDLAILALPMTLIIITGGIDLSVGSTMALSAVTLGMLYEAGTPIWIAGFVAIIVGTLAGAINGIFVARVGVHPLIVTLASMALYRGLAEGISLARPISGFPDGLQRLGGGTFAGVPISGMIFAAAAIGCMLLTARTVAGRWIYGIGDNERAASYAGIPIARTKLWLYSLSGTAAGVAALIAVGRRNTAKADIGSGIELEVITAVVLGGTSIFGGRGGILGTILGVALIHEVREFVSWHWQDDKLILIVIGVILIGSVLLNNLASRSRV